MMTMVDDRQRLHDGVGVDSCEVRGEKCNGESGWLWLLHARQWPRSVTLGLKQCDWWCGCGCVI